MAAGALGALIATVWVFDPTPERLKDWRAVLLFLVAVGLSPVIGILVSILSCAVVLAPLYHALGRANGGPFKPGDVVQILVGPDKGKVSTVYSMWQGNSVRVRLGSEEERTFKDVFGPNELLREMDNQSPAPA
jgi:hypothetical protein